MKEKIIFIKEKTKTGYSAYAEHYPVITTGKNIKELNKNIVDAMNSWLEHNNEPLIEIKDIYLRFNP